MKIIDKIIALFSKDMRSALELEKLNNLLERFNNGEDVEKEVVTHNWKYHQTGANFLMHFIEARKTLKN